MRTERKNRKLGIRARTPSPPPSSWFVASGPAAAPIATRREFVAALKSELPVALAHLQRGNIAPVDLAQAAIGPGMAVYTRYAKVLDAGGNALSVRDALALINQTLDEALAEQEGDFDADSRWALAWFEQSGFDEGEYGIAEMLSKAKNTSVARHGGGGHPGTSRAGKVRLLRPEELPPDWDPTTDPRLTAWEMVHHLVRALEGGGENAAAETRGPTRRQGRGGARVVLPPVHAMRAQETRGGGALLQQLGAELARDHSLGTRSRPPRCRAGWTVQGGLTMHVESIKLKNFKSFKDVTMLDIPHYCVIVGANGTGKSTLFDVFGFLKDCLTYNVRQALRVRGGYAEVVSRGDPGGAPIELEIQFRMEIAGVNRLVTYVVHIGLEKNRPVVSREILRYKRGRYGSPFHFLDFAQGQGLCRNERREFRQTR